MALEQSPIIIIGAGVLGLSIAHHLLYPTPTSATSFPPSQPPRPILIIASSLPTDPIPSIPASYASPWAGAHYRPIPASTPQLAFERDLALRTHTTMLSLAFSFPESQCGVASLPAEEYLEQPPDTTTKLLRSGDIYAGPGDNFHVLTAPELDAYNAAHTTTCPSPVQWGCTYQSYCVNPSVYLTFLLTRVQARGARVVQQHIPSLRSAFTLAEELGFQGAETVIDCSGRGVAHDPKTDVIRGQTVLVRRQCDRTVTRQGVDGSWSFLIPRPGGGGTVVGGTKEVGVWEGEVRKGVREGLLRRAGECFPEVLGGEGVSGGEVVRDNVGWRPWREGGVRLEVGDVDEGVGKGKRRRVIYGYGAGGRGYELSWGVAEKLAELVRQMESGWEGVVAKL